MGFSSGVWSFLRPLRSRESDASHREKRFAGIRASSGWQRSSRPFSTAQGGPLAAPASGIAPSVFRPDPRMATPYSQQASAGAEYLLAKNLTVRADYLFVHGVKLPRTLNVNLLPPVVLTLANASSLAFQIQCHSRSDEKSFHLGGSTFNLTTFISCRFCEFDL